MSDFIAQTDNKRRIFDVFDEIARIPDNSDTMLTDVYFSDYPDASSRIFRVFRTLPLHYHTECDEFLYVVSGEGTFHLNGEEGPVRPGMFLRYPRGEVHGIPKITKHPFVVLSVDVPRRRPDDIVFVNPEDGDAKLFMARNNT
jgi:mannose-6-phosphate isomerase-like protein (cupin superfamily)